MGGSQYGGERSPKYPYRFNGQEEDFITGLYNYGERLYDPVIGRFISADKQVLAIYNPQGINRYSYCLNNPVIYVDPTGEFGLLAAVAIGAAIGAALGAAQAGTEGNLFELQAWANFNWSAAAIGAIAGGVGGAIAPIAGAGVLAAVGVQGLGGAILAGAVGGAAVGGASYTVSWAASGKSWSWSSFGTAVGSGAISGAIMGSLTSGEIMPFLKGQKTFWGESTLPDITPMPLSISEDPGAIKSEDLTPSIDNFRIVGGEEVPGVPLTKHAVDKIAGSEGLITREAVENTIKYGNSFKYYYEPTGSYQVGYYDPATKLFVATENGLVVTTFKARFSYIRNLMKSQ